MCISSHFNPRSREGSDGVEQVYIFLLYVFQSTLPRGERPETATESKLITYFNPRSREGSDASPPRQPPEKQDFNPRSREGSDFNFI